MVAVTVTLEMAARTGTAAVHVLPVSSGLLDPAAADSPAVVAADSRDSARGSDRAAAVNALAKQPDRSSVALAVQATFGRNTSGALTHVLASLGPEG